MKKLLILIVAGALYFHFYPNEKLNTWLLAQKEVVLGSFSDATDTKIRLKSDKIYEDLQKHFAKFSAKEEQYVAEITASRTSVKEFYYEYCNTNKQTAKLHRENVKKVCEVINRYSSLL